MDASLNIYIAAFFYMRHMLISSKISLHFEILSDPGDWGIRYAPQRFNLSARQYTKEPGIVFPRRHVARSVYKLTLCFLHLDELQLGTSS